MPDPAPAAPLVSVVIPSFNHAAYIAATIDSVLAQDYPNFEIVIVDDGSSDGTHDLLRALPPDDRIKIHLNEKNAGQGVRLNFAIEQAEGAFICILPSDDLFLPGKLTAQVAKFAASDPRVGLVYTGGYLLDDATGAMTPYPTVMKSGDVLLDLLREFFFLPAATMIRKECFASLRFDESYVAEGEAIFCKIARDWWVAGIPDKLTAMRQHGRNTGRKVLLMYGELKRWYGDFLSDPTLPPAVLAQAPFLIARIHRMKGLDLIAAGHDRTIAREALRSAIRLHPPYRADPRVWIGLAAAASPPTAWLAHRIAKVRQAFRTPR